MLSFLCYWCGSWVSTSVLLVDHFDPDGNISTTNGRFAMKLCTDIHGPQRINPKDFSDPLTFSAAPSEAGILDWSKMS